MSPAQYRRYASHPWSQLPQHHRGDRISEMLSGLDDNDRDERALALRSAHLYQTRWPDDVHATITLMTLLRRDGQEDAAEQVLDRALDREWSQPHDRDRLQQLRRPPPAP